jgi:hypothetical protein
LIASFSRIHSSNATGNRIGETSCTRPCDAAPPQHSFSSPRHSPW